MGFCRKSFQFLKNSFTTAPILTHWEPDQPLVVETDTSVYTLAAIISMQTSEGKLHPIPFHSCTSWMHLTKLKLLQDWPATCLSLGLHCQRWWMENGISNSLWLIWMVGHAFRPHQHTCDFSTVHEWHPRRPTWSLHCCLSWRHFGLLWWSSSTQGTHLRDT